MSYKPGEARVGEPTPQTHPESFTSADLLAEAKYLIRANKRYGSNPPRTAAYLRLLGIIAERKANPAPAFEVVGEINPS